MKVVILCGGQGTRIRGVDDNLPKPMLPIGNLPILFHLMGYYAKFEHKDFVLCAGYKASVIKNFFLNYQALARDFTIDFGKGGKVAYHDGMDEIDWRVTMVDTGEATQTGSRVKRIERFIGDDDTFMLTYGDGLSNIDIDALLAFHKAHGRILTISGVRPPSRFGEIECNEQGQVFEFNEKPQTTGGRISGGFFVCSRRLFDYLDPKRSDEIMEQDCMRRLTAEGQLMMYQHDGHWQCMDTFRDFTLLNDLWNSGKAFWR